MIQEMIDNVLNNAIKYKKDPQFVSNLKFIKAELQRGKSKVIDDTQAINILVGLIKSQEETIKAIQDTNKISECTALIADIKPFLPTEVSKQISMDRDGIAQWLEINVDFSKLKSKMQAINIIKKTFPYIDGQTVKEILEEM